MSVPQRYMSLSPLSIALNLENTRHAFQQVFSFDTTSSWLLCDIHAVSCCSLSSNFASPYSCIQYWICTVKWKSTARFTSTSPNYPIKYIWYHETAVLVGLPATKMVVKPIKIVSQSDVCAVAFADERQIVGGNANGYIRGWNIEDGQQQGAIAEASSSVRSLVVSQDGLWMVSGDLRGKVIVWNAVTRRKVLELPENMASIWAVDISNDGTKIAYVDGETAQIFSRTSGDRLFPPLRHDWVVGVKFSPDSGRFATASYNHGFRVYSSHNGDILFSSGPKSSGGSWPVAPLVWTPDSQQLFVAVQGKITCVDVSNSSCSEWSIHETQSRVSIVSNGKFIACSAGSSVSLWDCASYKKINRIIARTLEDSVSCIALSPSGEYLACGVGKNITIHSLSDVLPPEYFYHDSR